MNNIEKKIKTAYADSIQRSRAATYSAFHREMRSLLEVDEDLYPTSQRGSCMFYQFSDTQRLRYNSADDWFCLEFRQWGRWIRSYDNTGSLAKMGDAIEHFERRHPIKKVFCWIIGTDF